MIIWGGTDTMDPADFPVNTGGVYDLATDSWTKTNTSDAKLETKTKLA